MSSTRYSPITRAKFRCERAMRDWAEMVTVLREASERSDYAGPSVAAVELVGAQIAEVRGQLLDWLIVTAARGRPLRRISRHKLAVIKQVLSEQRAER
jgi:hypothetical protein